jgi:hypothetical protein
VSEFSDGEAGISVLKGGPAIAGAFVERFVVEPESDGPLRGTAFAVKDPARESGAGAAPEGAP